MNKLISNIEWGMKGNFLDVPTDCPQRDERMGWTGDTQVFSATASYLADTYAFYRKYLYDLYQEQLLAGGMVPEIVPTFGPTKCSCAWGDAACIIPWNVYLFSGDKTILEKPIESMKRGSIISGELMETIMDGDRFSIMVTGLLLTVQVPLRTACMERLMKHTLQTSTTRQVHRLLQKQQRCLDWKKRDRSIRNRRPSVAGRERRIFYCYRQMCGEDADRAYSCTEISSV